MGLFLIEQVKLQNGFIYNTHYKSSSVALNLV